MRFSGMCSRLGLQAARIPRAKRLVSARQVSHLESMLPEKPERIIGPLSHAAMNPYLPLAREFTQAIPQLVERQVHRSLDKTASLFGRLADIDDQGIG